MTQGRIRISVSVDHDQDCTFDVEVSTSSLTAHCFFWADADVFKDFAAALILFPQAWSDSVAFEIGEEQPEPGRSYLLLKAACYNPQGHAALQVVLNNNEPVPRTQRLEFFIPAEVASLNALGSQLQSWKCDTDSVLCWEAQIS